MAKELPYFKFEPSEWNDGDITLCTLEEQGLFINICSLYWSKLGVLSYAKAKRRFSECNATAFESLINENIIIVKDDQLIISFLDKQFKERKILSEKNRLNALEMWEKKRAHSDGIANASVSLAIKKREEEKKKEKKRKEKEKKGVVFPFDSILFRKSWIIWKDYKKNEHKFSYKTVVTEQAALMKLNKLANGQENNAVEIINESIANGWKGFFKTETNNSAGNDMTEEEFHNSFN